MNEDEATEELQNVYLRVRLEELQDNLMFIAVHMHGVLGAFLEAGFSVEHAFAMAQSTYLSVLESMDL
jgi:hypothetical protein